MVLDLEKKYKEIWDEVLKKIALEINNFNTFNIYFKGTYLKSLTDGVATIVVPSNMVRAYLNTKCIKLIENHLSFVAETNLTVNIKLFSDLGEENIIEDEHTFNSTFDKTFTFDNFVVGESNKDSYNAALSVAKNPSYYRNPLFIFGKSGLGKTHLLKSIGYYIQNNSSKNMNIYYSDVFEFLDEYNNYFRNNQLYIFKDKMKKMDVLLLDDIQFLAGKEKTSEFFFQIFNHLVNSKKQIVITSDRDPNELRKIEDRLVSRFSAGLTIGINELEADTAIQILKRKIEATDLVDENIDEDVLGFIVSKFSIDVRQLEGALNTLVFYAISVNKRIDLELAYQAFKNHTPSKKRSEVLTIDKIQSIVSEYYNISKNLLVSKNRKAHIAIARQVAMYLSRVILDVPFKTIGAEFGNKDHSTVITACKKIEELVKKDTNYKEVIQKLKKQISS